MAINPKILDALQTEAARTYKKTQILEPGFAKQEEFIKDEFKKKTLFCTRRAAKSYTGGLYLFDTAIRYASCNCLYLGLTKKSAQGIMWKDILKEINRQNGIGTHFSVSALEATTPNDSVIYLTGIDADEDEMHKLLGKKYKLVIIDEAQSYSIDLRTLVYGILGPTVIDQSGTICMMGTAGNLTQGLFYDVTNGKEPGWKLFEWTAFDNPFVAKQWQAELDEITKHRPLFKETSLYKQWYLNQWVIDDDARVYRFNSLRNCAEHLPRDISDWHYVLGIDLAHSPDSSAFVVGCYHELSPTLYLVYAFKKTNMDITDVAEKTKQLEKTYNFEVKVVDGANKQAVAELNNRHGLNLICADKTGKVDFITLMNDDFTQRNIQLLPGTEELQDEYKRLIWITDANGKVKEPKKENPLIHQDLADSALYLWRYCYQYLYKKKPEFVDQSKQESWEPAHIAKLIEQGKKEQNPHGFDVEAPEEDSVDDWNKSWNDPL